MFWSKIFGQGEGYSQNPHEQIVIEKVIDLLDRKPDLFSAKWFTGRSLDTSIRSKDKSILILIKTGEILHPINPAMTKEQKEVVSKLASGIAERDSKVLAERLICNWD